jgi:hypothetical protein
MSSIFSISNLGRGARKQVPQKVGDEGKSQRQFLPGLSCRSAKRIEVGQSSQTAPTAFSEARFPSEKAGAASLSGRSVTQLRGNGDPRVQSLGQFNG